MSLSSEIARYYGQGKEQKNGAGWITCCPVHQEKTPSLSVTDDGDSVKVFCHVGCNFKEIKDRFRQDGVLPEWQPEPGGKEKKLESPKRKEDDKATRNAKYIWKVSKKTDECLEHIKKYFTNRAITIDPIPPCFKWNVYDNKKTGEVEHMIVCAASTISDGEVRALQSLAIDPGTHQKTGRGRMQGECTGRGVWFNRKGNLKEIIVGEGVENTLSGMQATGKNGVAALSWSGVENLIIPDEAETIYILVDSDTAREKEAASMVGQKASYRLANRFIGEREGRVAYLVIPDNSCFSENPVYLDFNDLLQADPTGESIRDRFSKAVEIRDLEWKPQEKGENSTGEYCSAEGCYPQETLESLTKMNKEYAAVLIGGDFRIAKEGFDNAAKKHTLSFLKITSLYSYYANSRVAIEIGAEKNIEYREMAKVWMTWDGRRTYDDVVFDPSETARPNAYNLFKGFPLTPNKGDWSLMREHIFKVICDGNSEHFEYVMAWMARSVQDPGGDKPGVALVLKGGKGIGKGVFVNYFGSIFGEAFLPIADSESFTGRFNMHLSKSLVVFLDEAVWGGDKKAEGKLKQLITEPTILFEPKGIDSLTMGNFINVIIASNEDWVVPATGDERRFCVLQPSAAFQQNTEYFGAIAKERRKGGAEAMMYDLLHYDHTTVDLRRAPMTEGLSIQVQASLPSVLEFWHSVLDRGYMLTDNETGRPKTTRVVEEEAPINELWAGAVFKYEVYTEYAQWCRSRSERYPKNEVHFWRDTWCVWDGGKPDLRYRRRDGNGKQLDAVLLPLLKEARKAFTDSTKISFEESDEDGAKEQTVMFSGQF